MKCFAEQVWEGVADTLEVCAAIQDRLHGQAAELGSEEANEVQHRQVRGPAPEEE